MFLFLFRFIKYLCAEKEKLKEIMEGNQSRRIDFVDLTKGVCIILVVMAHVGGAFEQLDTNSMLSCFRMPLYFFISGSVIALATSLLQVIRRPARIHPTKNKQIDYSFSFLLSKCISNEIHCLEDCSGGISTACVVE